MKLIFCPLCDDAVRIHVGDFRECRCGKSAGRYLNDGIHAELSGCAVPIGMLNGDFKLAYNRYRAGLDSASLRFETFFIGQESDRITRVTRPST